MAQPFGVDPQGRIAFTADPRQQLQARIRTVIGTNLSERVMRPTYGVPMIDYLFESDDSTSASQLTSDIRTAVETFEPGVVLNDVEATFGQGDGLIGLDVSYATSNSTSSESLSIPVNSAALYRGGAIEEQRRG